MILDCRHFELALRHPFTISRESYTSQPTMIVSLEEDGQTGYGEATTNAYYGVTLQSLRDALETVRRDVHALSLQDSDPTELWDVLAPKLRDAPFALCALDQAAHDLWGKLRGRTVYQLWGLSLDDIPCSCFTIGIDTIEVMAAKMLEMDGWPIYKIKLGTDHDVEIVRALRQHTDATFRVDANCGWSLDAALRNAEALAKLDVEFIEQPLPADQYEAQRLLYQRSALPLFADESCIAEADVANCQASFHGVNIKLPKCGGLTPARRMINEAKHLGLQVMVGCMTESTVGISAIAQLLPLLDYVDMDGAALLAHDIATGVVLDHGVCRFPQRAGTGVALLA